MSLPPPPPPSYRRTRTRERAGFLAEVLTRAVQGPITWWADSAHYTGPDPDAELPDAQVVIIDRASRASWPVTIEDIARAVWRIGARRVPGLDPRDALTRRVWTAQHDNDPEPLTDDDLDLIMQVAATGRMHRGRIDAD